ncbi:hypothetical protein [Dokdonia sp.]|uniref:tetratricopeptide repeat-containing sensor histidine kinase n=1 Tax=Dokdonia sp. TaxID=2024995 RepID=UPI003267D461
MKHILVASLFLIISCKTVNDESSKDNTELYTQLQNIFNNDSISNVDMLSLTNSYFKKVKNTNRDTLLYRTLLLKTFLHSKEKELDSAIYYSNYFLDKAIEKRDTFYIAKAYLKLGKYNKDEKRLSESFDSYNNSFSFFRSIDSIEAGRALFEMSKIQKKIGDFSGSLETATDALKYSENTDDVKTILGLYQSIATVYREQENYEKAQKYIEKAITLSQSPLGIKKIVRKNLLTCEITQANIHKDQGDYSKATTIFNKLLSDSLVIENKKEKARIQSNLGYTLWLKDKENLKSEKLLQDALKERQKIEDINGLIASNIHLTQYYKGINNEKSLQYAQEALMKSKQVKSLYSIKESLGYIIDLKDNLIYEARLFKEIDNELTKLRRKTQDIYAITRFENDENQKEIQALEVDNVKEKLKKTISIITAIMIGLIGIFFTLFLVRKHKKEKTRVVIRETFQTERRLSKKIHDELANDMSDTLNYVDNHTEIPTTIKTHLVNKLDDIYDRTRDISAEIGGFESKDFAKNLKFLITQHRTKGVKVITNVMTGINWDIVSDHKKINIYRSLQELLVNMKKHSKATEVTVIFKSEENKNFINYMDNGIGVAIDDVPIRGLQNVETRIKNIGGNVTFITSKGNGFKARLYFLN